MDEILHTPREESSAIRPPLAQLRDRWEAGTAALAQRVEPLRRRLDAATAGGRRLINPLHFLAAAVVIGVAAVVGTVYTPSYVVEVDGVPWAPSPAPLCLRMWWTGWRAVPPIFWATTIPWTAR